MSDLLQVVKGLSVQPKCVLVLGARTEAMLNWLFSLTATQVILVEPEPAMFEKATVLHNAKDTPENVVIKHGAPAFEAEQKSTRYFVSNIPGFSSVLTPNVIKSIRPALEFTEQEIPLIDLKPLLQQFDISEGRPCLLISQLNGAEQQCLNDQILSAFTHVVIQSSLKPIFGEAKSSEKLKKELTQCGRDYFVLAESMPPYSNFVATKKVNAEQALNYFSQRQQHREIKVTLESQLSASQSDAKKLAEELQQAKEQLQTAKQQSEEEQKQLGDELLQVKEQLQNAKQQSEEKQNQLDSELQQAKEQLQIVQKQAEDSLKRLQEEMQHTNQKLLEERNQEHHWHNEHKKWAESLNREKEELVKSNEKLTNRLSESQSEKEMLAAEIEKIKQRESKLTTSVEVNAKLILKMQLDSDDLRTKYAQKTQSEKELRQLIGELHSKLQQAANFYHQLENKHPEILLGSDNID
ncbi:hypothetical protein ACZ81_17180 [Alteromonas macleodii]|uniref:hypothetical protein n=1 Tax=Alteromonas macleodii TaxID=28108 RepID=UPI0007775AFE|nr:hypothetical protein [Alteromonas macleodii]AMN13160.1 hypothetical protein ACZ81_17180 [Alteromonas macleodii]MBL3811654.1 hypothetical protein [Alteromonas macleodii]MBL3885192.1 hypothetical protein [Alteromonas macleodii]